MIHHKLLVVRIRLVLRLVSRRLTTFRLELHGVLVWDIGKVIIFIFTILFVHHEVFCVSRWFEIDGLSSTQTDWSEVSLFLLIGKLTVTRRIFLLVKVLPIDCHLKHSIHGLLHWRASVTSILKVQILNNDFAFKLDQWKHQHIHQFYLIDFNVNCLLKISETEFWKSYFSYARFDVLHILARATLRSHKFGDVFDFQFLEINFSIENHMDELLNLSRRL